MELEWLHSYIDVLREFSRVRSLRRKGVSTILRQARTHRTGTFAAFGYAQLRNDVMSMVGRRTAVCPSDF